MRKIPENYSRRCSEEEKVMNSPDIMDWAFDAMFDSLSSEKREDYSNNIKQENSLIDKAIEAYENALTSFPAPGEGHGSHSALMSVANRGIAAGISGEEIVDDLQRYIPAGSKNIPLSQIEAAVKKAQTTPYRPGKSNGAVAPTTKPQSPRRLPDVLTQKLIAEGWGTQEEDFLNISPVPIPQVLHEQALLMLSLYEDSDVLFIGSRYDKRVKTVADWKVALSQPNASLPELFCPNIFSGEEVKTSSENMSYRADACVKIFRFAVAEMDSTSPGGQLAILMALIKHEAPVVAITHSGGKSYHAILAINGVENTEQWTELIENGLFRHYLEPLGIDGACKNEGRLTRLPGAYRADKDKTQRLIYFNPNAGVSGRDCMEVLKKIAARFCPPPPMVALPGGGRTDGEFCTEFFKAISVRDLFFRRGEQIVMAQRGNIKPLDVEAVSIDIEASVNCGKNVKVSTGSSSWTSQNASPALLKRVFLSTYAQALPLIKYVSDISLPYRKNDGSLGFSVPGYDRAAQMFTCNAPDITLMPVNKARELLFNLLEEFCFLELKTDRARALAYLLTPCLRTFYGGRTMGFFLSGNRPGVGKDCLLELPFLIYNGKRAAFNTPCNSDDEWRKELFSSALKGTPIFLVGNVKNKLDFSALEQAMTSTVLSGRILGTNQMPEIDNTALFGFSGNGVQLTPDLERRFLVIRLEYYDEDIAARRFSRDITLYTLDNRLQLLGAVYSLIKYWASSGYPKGETEILNFSDWSTAISGLMSCCELGDPFAARELASVSLDSSGNEEDKDFRLLFSEWYAKHGNKYVPPSEIRNMVAELGLFSGLDLNTQSGCSRLGKMVAQRDKRVYAGFRLFTTGVTKHRLYRLERASVPLSI